MATITISGLPEVSTLLDTSNIPIETATVTQRITGANLKSYLAALPTISATSGVISGLFQAGSLTVSSAANIDSLTSANVLVTNATVSNLTLTGPLISNSTATFSGNVNANNFNATVSVNAPSFYGAVKTAAQPSITSVGTLSSLTLGGTLRMSNLVSPNTATVQWGDNSGWKLRYMTSVSGTPTERFGFTDTGNFNAVGSISSATATTTDLTVSGTTTVPSITKSGTTNTGTIGQSNNVFSNVYSNTFTGTSVNATNLTGTVQTADQPNITSLGTLTGLTTPSITHWGPSGTGDIGSPGLMFGVVYATASSARYADLAERYESDFDYEPGTVMIFGVDTETTISRLDNDRRVAGVVSTNPAYLMNSEATGVAIALQGRVPCKVAGKIARGDLLVTSNLAGVAMANNDPKPGTVIGKALENYNSDMIGVIEVVVGRL